MVFTAQEYSRGPRHDQPEKDQPNAPLPRQRAQLSRRGGQGYYLPEPKKRDARYDQRADSRLKGQESPDNGLATATERELLNMHRSQLANS